MALLVGAFALALYLRTVAPGLLAGDPGEFQFAAWSLGLAHPTGYPFYLILGYLWQHGLAFFDLSPAWSLNVLSVFCGALAVALTYWVQVRWLEEKQLGGNQTIHRSAALVSASFFGLNPTFWNQSLIAEVYSLHMVFVVLIVLAAQQLAIATRKQQASSLPLFMLALCVGLSLTHHLMIIWIIPGLLLYLFTNRATNQVGALNSQPYPRFWKQWPGAILVALVPLLLYLYIPLGSGPTRSPWYHQPLGQEVLSLYENNWSGFIQYVSGRSISVGFRSLSEALAGFGFALEQWLTHFTWLGLLLVFLGALSLLLERRWPILLWTGSFLLLQQGFNLFYKIGDIFVYYIPLYWIGAIWIGFAAANVGNRLVAQMAQMQRQTPDEEVTERGHSQLVDHQEVFEPPAKQVDGGHTENDPARESHTPNSQAASKGAQFLGALAILVILLIPIRTAQRYFPQIDQSGNNGTRLRWEEILAANPPENAILVSNDRNEIVPLFYLQEVEGRALSMRGLFPLISPQERFRDLGTTLSTALDTAKTEPIYLIKPMPGLAARFALQSQTPPLVQVIADAVQTEPTVRLELPQGPLILIGYDWTIPAADSEVVHIGLQWQVQEPIIGDYTATVQLYNASGERIAQDDRPPGGIYYPTSLWKPSEKLSVEHKVSVPDGEIPVAMLVGFYDPNTLALLTSPLEIPLPHQE
ncbi:MAG: DUF2723 domain-containing protein [Chloroflexota bacterium]